MSSLRDFDDSTLWRVSDFERVRRETGTSGFAHLDGASRLPTTLQADLQKLEFRASNNDVLEVIAACMRHKESALVCLQHDQWVWPITLFPTQMMYHSPRDMAATSSTGMATLKVLTTEPPGVKPIGHWMTERVAQDDQYRPLTPLLWAMALNGPRKTLLTEIAGAAAYRAINGPSGERPVAPGPVGAMGSAVEKLRRDLVSVREVASWPGMSVERACRLLNALYLSSNLMVSRTSYAARPGSKPATAPATGLAAWRKRLGF